MIVLTGVFVLGAGTGIAITALLREPPVAPIVAAPPSEPVAPAPTATPTPVVVAPVTEVDPSPSETPAATAPAAPTIDLIYPKDARARIDGELLEGKLPLMGVSLEPGTRQITILWKGKRKDLILDAQPGVHATLGKDEYRRGGWE